MDLREYEYITRRPDSFPKSTLMSIRKILSRVGSGSVRLIDKLINESYIPPPAEYKWHGFYKIFLTDTEKQMILDALHAAENILSKDSGFASGEMHYLKQYISYWSRCVHEVPETYDEYKANQKYYNLLNITYNEFHAFLFDHPEEETDRWYCDFNMWLEYDEEHIVNLYIKLFGDAQALLSTYSKEQLEQGLWAIVSGSLGCSTYNLIWKSELSIIMKEKLIFSMFCLFEKLYSVDSLDTSCDMWWDSLAYSFYEGGCRDPEADIGVKHVQNAMFATLKKILGLQSNECQLAALHGLGHLRHPDTESLIERYLSENMDLSNEHVSYAKACIKGDIM